MLVLTRKPGETFVLGPGNESQIRIKVLDSTPGRVRIGIDAPRELLILREELIKENVKDDTK